MTWYLVTPTQSGTTVAGHCENLRTVERWHCFPECQSQIFVFAGELKPQKW